MTGAAPLVSFTGVTRSYGEVPLFGEHLARLLNRDRNGQAYFEATRWRIRAQR